MGIKFWKPTPFNRFLIYFILVQKICYDQDFTSHWPEVKTVRGDVHISEQEVYKGKEFYFTACLIDFNYQASLVTTIKGKYGKMSITQKAL